MKTTNLKTSRMKEVFVELNEKFGGELTVSPKEYTLEFDSILGSGRINGMVFDGGISHIEFDVRFNEALSFALTNANTSTLYFAYCNQGSLGHSFGTTGKKRVVQKFQTGIATCRGKEQNTLYFEEQEYHKVSLIVVQPDVAPNLQKSKLIEELKQTFFTAKEKENFIYIGSHNLKIASKIEELNAIDQQGVARKLMHEGIVHVILAMEVQQHADDAANSTQQNFGGLTLKEMEQVKELSKFIEAYPEEQFTLKSLSRRSGLSGSKLQIGFKLLHNRTVRDFITHKRVVKSEQLIRTTDLNISEIVYSIGFMSRSYFSKIFKQKYKCSPKTYKDQHNSLAVTA